MFYTNVRSPVKRKPATASSRRGRLPAIHRRGCAEGPPRLLDGTDPSADPTTGIGETRSVARRIVIGVMVGAGLAIGVAWGLKSAIAYFSLLAIVVVLVWGAAAGGDFIADVSRRRFDDRDRP